ncbi:uncharacterized protein PHALS_09416 [Plasmopara halstedii]|uniref:Uncharacterized protein n=1 Tax=Plasmopara halstedii TaxID=4781 RepID=A0A0P1A533_PLAHL|nr:uncharacterized protein PHALS_09416 [Plasmopara halstedii]CEG35289.1 hypothetical protein PHALS_09416 [Plasmopara halstedii]|eukprot:XP_024571658.1 hypothetical protein PHALS_09416 [Plasmopara halstedii]
MRQECYVGSSKRVSTGIHSKSSESFGVNTLLSRVVVHTRPLSYAAVQIVWGI